MLLRWSANCNPLRILGVSVPRSRLVRADFGQGTWCVPWLGCRIRPQPAGDLADSVEESGMQLKHIGRRATMVAAVCAAAALTLGATAGANATTPSSGTSG